MDFFSLLKFGFTKEQIQAALTKVGLTRNSKLELWAGAIKVHEGWYPGSRSYRNNNPGNLRYSPYQLREDDRGFCIFKDYVTGWQALLHQLTLAATGKSGVYHPTMTLYQFFEVYAPAADNNYPRAYAQAVARYIGVAPETQIKDLAN